MDYAQGLIYISTSAIRTHDPLQALELLRPLTSNIELTGGCAHDPALLSKLVAYQKTCQLNLLLHNYFPPPAEHFVLNFADTGMRTRSFIARAMEFARSLNIPYYSVHAGFRGDFDADRHGLLHPVSEQSYSLAGIHDNAAWFRSQWPMVPLALENVYPNNGNTACAFMMSLDEICETMDSIPQLRLLLDLGHLNVSALLMGFNFMSAAKQIFARYCSRISEIHLSENHGAQDDHLPLTVDSPQLGLISLWAPHLREHRINVTLETRGESVGSVASSYRLVQAAMYPTD